MIGFYSWTVSYYEETGCPQGSLHESIGLHSSRGHACVGRAPARLPKPTMFHIITGVDGVVLVRRHCVLTLLGPLAHRHLHDTRVTTFTPHLPRGQWTLPIITFLQNIEFRSSKTLSTTAIIRITAFQHACVSGLRGFRGVSWPSTQVQMGLSSHEVTKCWANSIDTRFFAKFLRLANLCKIW